MNILNNVKWISVAQFGKLLTQLIAMVVLARLIPPPELGLMAMAMVIFNFSSLVRDLGTSSAVIQKYILEDKTINAIFGINLIMGFSIGLFIIFFSPLIAYFFSQPKLQSILLLLSISFPIMSCGSVHLALL